MPRLSKGAADDCRPDAPGTYEGHYHVEPMSPTSGAVGFVAVLHTVILLGPNDCYTPLPIAAELRGRWTGPKARRRGSCHAARELGALSALAAGITDRGPGTANLRGRLAYAVRRGAQPPTTAASSSWNSRPSVIAASRTSILTATSAEPSCTNENPVM